MLHDPHDLNNHLFLFQQFPIGFVGVVVEFGLQQQSNFLAGSILLTDDSWKCLKPSITVVPSRSRNKV